MAVRPSFSSTKTLGPSGQPSSSLPHPTSAAALIAAATSTSYLIPPDYLILPVSSLPTSARPEAPAPPSLVHLRALCARRAPPPGRRVGVAGGTRPARARAFGETSDGGAGRGAAGGEGDGACGAARRPRAAIRKNHDECGRPRRVWTDERSVSRGVIERETRRNATWSKFASAGAESAERRRDRRREAT